MVLRLKAVVADLQIHSNLRRLAGRVEVTQLGTVVAEHAVTVKREGSQLDRQPVVWTRLVEVVEAGGGELARGERGPSLVQTLFRPVLLVCIARHSLPLRSGRCVSSRASLSLFEHFGPRSRSLPTPTCNSTRSHAYFAYFRNIPDITVRGHEPPPTSHTSVISQILPSESITLPACFHRSQDGSSG